MITTAILNVIYAMIRVILSPILFFGDVVLPTSILTSIQTGYSWMVLLNSVVPLDQLVLVIFALVGIEGAVALYKAIMWAIRRIPGQG